MLNKQQDKRQARGVTFNDPPAIQIAGSPISYGQQQQR